jgi:DNA-binding response OmpR family regulator
MTVTQSVAVRPLVLIMDDEENIRRAMRSYLDRHGYIALEADSVDRAVDAMRTNAISAVILDMRLPGTRSGLDALHELRRIPEMATVPVLIVTGSILSEQEERHITRQRAHVVYKPEGFNTVVNFLDQLTGRDYSH